MCCCDGVRLDGRSLALLEHVLVSGERVARQHVARMSPLAARSDNQDTGAGRLVTSSQGRGGPHGGSDRHRRAVRRARPGARLGPQRQHRARRDRRHPRRRAGQPRRLAAGLRPAGRARHFRGGGSRRGRRGGRQRRGPVRHGRGGGQGADPGSGRHHRAGHPGGLGCRVAGRAGRRRAVRRAGAAGRHHLRARCRSRWVPPTAGCCCCRPTAGGWWSTPQATACTSSRWPRPTSPGRWPGGLGPGHRAGANPRAGRGAGRDRAGGRGRRDHPLVAADRRRLRQGPRAVRQADRQLPGDKTPLRRNAVPRRAGRSGRRRRRPRGRRGRPGPVLPRGGPGRGHRHHRGQGQRQGLHPGARRHRLHLGTRRPPVPAPCPRHRPLPGRGGTLAAPYHRAHPGGRAPPAGYRPDRGRGPAAPDHRGRRPHRRAARRAAAGTGRRRTGAAPRRPSSC